MPIINDSLYGLGDSASAGISNIGWLITAGVFIATFVILFLIIRNFRRAIYGSVVNAFLVGGYKISRFIGLSAEQGDFEPLKFFGWVAGWVIFAIIFGYIVEWLGWTKKFEDKIRD